MQGNRLCCCCYHRSCGVVFHLRRERLERLSQQRVAQVVRQGRALRSGCGARMLWLQASLTNPESCKPRACLEFKVLVSRGSFSLDGIQSGKFQKQNVLRLLP
eukprot:1643846-Pleurochrysis_carterae.AAC.1